MDGIQNRTDGSASIPDRIDSFIRRVGRYLQLDHQEQLVVGQAKGRLPGPASEHLGAATAAGKAWDDFTAEVYEVRDQRMGEAAAIEQDGRVLAALLADPSPVLRVIHAVRGGGGGPAGLRAIWADCKVALEVVGVKARTPADVLLGALDALAGACARLRSALPDDGDSLAIRQATPTLRDALWTAAAGGGEACRGVRDGITLGGASEMDGRDPGWVAGLGVKLAEAERSFGSVVRAVEHADRDPIAETTIDGAMAGALAELGPCFRRAHDELAAVVAAGEAGAGPPATGERGGRPANGRKTRKLAQWENVRDELLKMKRRGQTYTSLNDLENRLDGEGVECSGTTIRKARDKTPELAKWMARAASTRPPRARSLTGRAMDEATQGREPDPTEGMTDRESAALAKIMDKAPPEKRAHYNAMTPQQHRELVRACMESQRDHEPSPLEPDPPSDRPRRVKSPKLV